MTDDDAFLADLLPTIDEVDAEIAKRNYIDALNMSLSRLVSLVMGTFSREGVEIIQTDGLALAEHDLGEVVFALNRTAQDYLAITPEASEKLKAAAGVLDSMSQLFAVLSGQYQRRSEGEHMAAVCLAAVNLGHWSMLLGNERIGLREMAEKHIEREVKSHDAIEAANAARAKKAETWRIALERFCTKDILASYSSNKDVADAFRQSYNNSGRSAPRSNAVDIEVAAIRKRQRDALH